MRIYFAEIIWEYSFWGLPIWVLCLGILGQYGLAVYKGKAEFISFFKKNLKVYWIFIIFLMIITAGHEYYKLEMCEVNGYKISQGTNKLVGHDAGALCIVDEITYPSNNLPTVNPNANFSFPVQ